MLIPQMDALRNISEFHVTCAFYHGYMAALKSIMREHGDDPAIATTINFLADTANSDMAAEFGR